MIHPTIAELAVPLDQLRPYERNPRRGRVDLIAESLRTNGQYRPIVARTGTNHVLVGNHTLAAARELGWEQIAVTWVEVDDEAAARIVLADNRTTDVAGYDDTLLAELLSDLPDLDGTGYTADDLDDLLAGLDAHPVLPEQDSDAAYAETAEQAARREAATDSGQSYAARGLREAVLVLTVEDHDTYLRLLAGLRERWGDQLSNGELVLRALRAAAEEPAAA